MITVTVGGRPQIDRIVGRAVFPNFGQGSFTPTDLGEGAEITTAGLGRCRRVGRPAGSLPMSSRCCVSRLAPGGRPM
jgi:hypothetical protein